MKALIKDTKKIKIIQQTFSALKKIGEDIKLEVDGQAFVMRSLNSAKSALPVVKFLPAFFTSYQYNVQDQQIICQLSISSLVFALKKVNNITSISFSIDPTITKLVLCVETRLGITHSWELFIQDTVLLAALYDIETAIVTANCRFDIFNGMKSAFRGNENIYMEVTRAEGPTQMIISSTNFDNCLSSSLTIKHGDSCDCVFNDDSLKIKLKLDLRDFLIAIKLASLFSQKFEMSLISPGHPIVIKSSMADQISFEVVLATGPDEFSSEDTSQNYEMGTPNYNSTLSQHSGPPGGASLTNSWRRTTVHANPPSQADHHHAPSINSQMPSLSEEDSQGIRDSQILAMGLFEESPNYPYKRRITGLHADDSQPSSDTSDTD